MLNKYPIVCWWNHRLSQASQPKHYSTAQASQAQVAGARIILGYCPEPQTWAENLEEKQKNQRLVLIIFPIYIQYINAVLGHFQRPKSRCAKTGDDEAKTFRQYFRLRMVRRSLEQSTIASFTGTQWLDLTQISYIYIIIYIWCIYIHIYTWYLGVWIPACSAGCLEHFRHRARDGFVSVHVVSVSSGRQGRQKNKKPTWYWWGSDYSLWSCASKLDFFGEWHDIINHIQHLSDSPWMFSNNCNLVVVNVAYMFTFPS